MVGHTHDDVDQMFSRFNTGLKNHRALIFTLTDFIKVIEKSFTPKPTVFFLYGVRDWKSWLDTASAQVYGNMLVHGHLRPHQFKFIKSFSSDQHAEMKYKRWARDEEWFPLLIETQRIFLLQKHLTIDTLQPAKRRWLHAEEYAAVLKKFKVCEQFFPMNDQTKDRQVEEMHVILSRWQGMVEENNFHRVPIG